MKKRIAVIGNGVMTFDCIKHINKNPDSELILIITDPKHISPSLAKGVDKFCVKHTIKHESRSDLNSIEIVNQLRSEEIDYIFNIDSFTILQPEILNIPKCGFINFHNSPLPNYRGANAPSWAIINDEPQFGVTWHFMDQEIDTGEIIWQKMFDISPNETARSLIFKCIEEGIKVFKENYEYLILDNFKSYKQTGEGSRYYRKNKPYNGFISLEWPTRKIDCFFRGLNFKPFENKFIRPKIKLFNVEYYVNELKPLAENAKSKEFNSGEVLSVSEHGLELKAADGSILLQNISDMDDNKISFESKSFLKSINQNENADKVA